jgi:hypothetical protein
MLTNLIAKITGEKIVPLKKGSSQKQYQLTLKKKSKLVNQENKLSQLL